MNLAEHPTVRRFRESNSAGNAESPHAGYADPNGAFFQIRRRQNTG
jgi:hypothetical protein